MSSEQVSVDLKASTETVEVDKKVSTEQVNVDIGFNRPNILLIIVDDIGVDLFGGVSQYDSWLQTWAQVPNGGVSWPQLPTFQAIADEGVVFTECRTMPNCSPSRASYLSGRYGFRTGVGTVVRDDRCSAEFSEFSVTPSETEVLLPQLLKTGGYRTGIFGKWHLALPDGGVIPNGIPWDEDPPNSATQNGYTGSAWLHPTNIGFDVSRFTFQNLSKEPIPPPLGGNSPGFHNFYWYDSIDDRVNQSTVYHTTKTRQELQNFIRFQGGEPWFGVWALSACHSPFGNFPDNGQGWSGCMPQENAKWSATGVFDPDTIWGSSMAALESIDFNLDQLKQNIGDDTWDRTVIIIVGDNGSDGNILSDGVTEGEDWGTFYETNVINANRLKQFVWEGGIRVPMIIKGPLVRNGGRTSNERVDFVDLYNTIRVIAGVSYGQADESPLIHDSYNFADVLRSASGTTARNFSFSEKFEPNGDPANATLKLRSYSLDLSGSGSWKVLKELGSADRFFHLANAAGSPVDPYEQTDVVGVNTDEYQEVALALQTLLNTEP